MCDELFEEDYENKQKTYSLSGSIPYTWRLSPKKSAYKNQQAFLFGRVVSGIPTLARLVSPAIAVFGVRDGCHITLLRPLTKKIDPVYFFPMPVPP